MKELTEMAKRLQPQRNTDPLALHGLLPLVVDGDTGGVRFARPGHSEPPLRDVSDLPEAKLEVVAFASTQALTAWHAAVREFAGNHVAVSVPEIDRPRFALLTRFDLDPHPGTTLEQVVPLRFPTDKAEVPGLQEASWSSARDAERTHREAAAVAAIERGWADELARLRRMSGIDVYVSGRPEEGPTVTTKGYNRSDSWSLVRAPDGGVVASTKGLLLRTTAEAMDADLRTALDKRLRKVGIHRRGLSFSLPLDDLDEASVGRLAEAGDAIQDALRNVDRVTSLRGVAQSLKEDRDLLALMRIASEGFPVVMCPWNSRDGAVVSPRRGLLNVGGFVLRRAIEKGCLEAAWSRTHDQGHDIAFVPTEFGRRLLTDGIDELARAIEGRPTPSAWDEPGGAECPIEEVLSLPDKAAAELVRENLENISAVARTSRGAASLAAMIAERLAASALQPAAGSVAMP